MVGWLFRQCWSNTQLKILGQPFLYSWIALNSSTSTWLRGFQIKAYYLYCILQRVFKNITKVKHSKDHSYLCYKIHIKLIVFVSHIFCISFEFIYYQRIFCVKKKFDYSALYVWVLLLEVFLQNNKKWSSILEVLRMGYTSIQKKNSKARKFLCSCAHIHSQICTY